MKWKPQKGDLISWYGYGIYQLIKDGNRFRLKAIIDDPDPDYKIKRGLLHGSYSKEILTNPVFKPILASDSLCEPGAMLRDITAEYHTESSEYKGTHSPKEDWILTKLAPATLMRLSGNKDSLVNSENKIKHSDLPSIEEMNKKEQQSIQKIAQMLRDSLPQHQVESNDKCYGVTQTGKKIKLNGPMRPQTRETTTMPHSSTLAIFGNAVLTGSAAGGISEGLKLAYGVAATYMGHPELAESEEFQDAVNLLLSIVAIELLKPDGRFGHLKRAPFFFGVSTAHVHAVAERRAGPMLKAVVTKAREAVPMLAASLGLDAEDTAEVASAVEEVAHTIGMPAVEMERSI